MIFLVLSAILVPAAPSSASPGVPVIKASPGDTVTFSGHGPAGGKVTLSASSNPKYVFAGWSGGGCSGAGTCTVTLNSSTTIIGTFKPKKN